MPFTIAYPFDPAELLPVWEKTTRDAELNKGYDDEDDLDDDDDDMRDEERNR